MREDEIKKLLQQADIMAGGASPVRVNLSAIHRRAKHKKVITLTAPLAAAAVLMVTVGILALRFRNTEPTQEQKIASLETQVKQLQARTDAAFNFIQQVLEEERRQNQLDKLEAQLASIPDPLEEVQKQVDKTAFILVYQADRMYRELNQTDSAVENYKRVIELFPDNRWAKVARERLEEIENNKYDKSNSKGDLKWKTQNTSLS
jgi:tetratricopeptide (TPR) repeat protein